MSALETLLAKLPEAKKTASGYSARCPAHNDRTASLSIAEGDDGRALVNCHAGCEAAAVVAALGLTMADLMPPRDAPPKANGKAKPAGKRRIVAAYDYKDEAGTLLFQAVRFDPKDFRQRKPKPGGGWIPSVKGVRQVPYRLPELLAEPSRAVYVVEGEKDADALARVGVLATCNHGGAGKWTAAHAEHLRGRRVAILPDNDPPGRDHARKVAASLQGVAQSVRVVDLPGLPEKGDVSDWLSAGGTKTELKQLIEAAPDWAPEAEPWPEIERFDAANLPAFPTDALPEALRRWVEEESHATQTPADLAGLLALAVCSACVARRVEVEPRPGWREPANLFAAVLLEPGNRKSAVFADATAPLKEIEAERVEAARPEVAREQSDRRQAEKRLAKLEKAAAEKDDAEARREAGDMAADLAERPLPALPKLIVDDATGEKLGMILAEQGGRVASMSPEGGVFDLMAGLYSKSGAPQFGTYLMAHAGDDLRTDRVGRESVRVERPALTCAYAIQPAVIEGLADCAAFRGRGLLARFLYAAPRSRIGRREIAAEPVSDATKEAYRQTIRALLEVEGGHTLPLTADALRSFEEWEAEIESALDDGGAMEAMRDWGAKLAGATLRLASVLHCAEQGPEGSIGRATIAAATKIARYLIPHAETTLNLMQAREDTADDDARYLLRWIERDGLREFSQRDAHRHGQRRFAKADDIAPALAELERRGYVRRRTTETNGPGRSPSPAYEVNPAVFDPPKTVDRIDRITAPPDERVGSVNSVSASGQSENENRVRLTI